MSFSWASPNEDLVLRMTGDRPVTIVSDLHLGDGSQSDAFMGKDRLLMEVIEEVAQERGVLVINGDAIDLLQAHDLTPVLKAHGPLLRAIADCSTRARVIYLTGNHDHDIRVYRDFLRWEVASRLWVDDASIQHGHQFDPFIGEDVKAAGAMTRVHHAVERRFGVWLRIPLHDFYTLPNRLTFWLGYRGWQLTAVRNQLLRAIGLREQADRSQRYMDYWVRSEAGDPMTLTFPSLRYGRTSGAKAVVCGHAHMPGNFVEDGVRYVNTGSWTFRQAQVTRLEGGEFTVRDRITGVEYGRQLYAAVLAGELDDLHFERWWRNQYLGWLRFRKGELRRRQGRA